MAATTKATPRYDRSTLARAAAKVVIIWCLFEHERGRFRTRRRIRTTRVLFSLGWEFYQLARS